MYSKIWGTANLGKKELNVWVGFGVFKNIITFSLGLISTYHRKVFILSRMHNKDKNK